MFSKRLAVHLAEALRMITEAFVFPMEKHSRSATRSRQRIDINTEGEKLAMFPEAEVSERFSIAPLRERRAENPQEKAGIEAPDLRFFVYYMCCFVLAVFTQLCIPAPEIS